MPSKKSTRANAQSQPRKLNATAQRAYDFWNQKRKEAPEPSPEARKAPKKRRKALSPSKLASLPETARKAYELARKRSPRSEPVYRPRPAPGQPTRQAYIDGMNERSERARAIMTKRGETLMKAKYDEILGFFSKHKPRSRRPAKTAAKLASRMGLLKFFEIQRQYSTNPLHKIVRSDFMIDKDKNGKQFAYWKKGNRAGEPGGKRISITDMRVAIEQSKDARGAAFVRKVLRVSPTDAAAIWQEMKLMPEFFAKEFGPEGERVVISPKVTRKK